MSVFHLPTSCLLQCLDSGNTVLCKSNADKICSLLCILTNFPRKVVAISEDVFGNILNERNHNQSQKFEVAEFRAVSFPDMNQHEQHCGKSVYKLTLIEKRFDDPTVKSTVSNKKATSSQVLLQMQSCSSSDFQA